MIATKVDYQNSSVGIVDPRTPLIQDLSNLTTESNDFKLAILRLCWAWKAQ